MASAVARPMPEAPPVTSATLRSRMPAICCFLPVPQLGCGDRFCGPDFPGATPYDPAPPARNQLPPSCLYRRAFLCAWVSGMTSEIVKLRVGIEALSAAQRVPYVDAFPVRLADVNMPGQHRLHVLIHGIKVVAIDRRIVVAVRFGKAMREIAAAAGIHEFAAL